MGEIKAKYDRYGIKEWFLFGLGAIALMIQLYRYAMNTLEGSTLDIGVFAIAVLLILAPLTIVNLIRKARGIETK